MIGAIEKSKPLNPELLVKPIKSIYNDGSQSRRNQSINLFAKQSIEMHQPRSISKFLVIGPIHIIGSNIDIVDLNPSSPGKT